MYFPGDPLLEFDPIFLSVRDEASLARLTRRFDWSTTEEERALGYHFDIVIGGHLATPMDPPHDRRVPAPAVADDRPVLPLRLRLASPSGRDFRLRRPEARTISVHVRSTAPAPLSPTPWSRSICPAPRLGPGRTPARFGRYRTDPAGAFRS